MKNALCSLLALLLLASCSKEAEVITPPAPNKYTLTITAEAGGTVSSPGGTYNEGSKITITATPDGQYLFEKWSDGSTVNPREITVSANLTLSATFVKKAYPLSVTIEGEGTVQEEVIIQGSTSRTEYKAGTTVRLTAAPNEGWVFAGWSGDVESEEKVIEVAIEKGTSVSALFKRSSFELNITIVGEGTVTEEVIVQPSKYDFETVLKLTAVPAEGQKFIGWSGDIVSEENPVEVELTSEINITANFESIAFSTLSERFSAINETTGYFKSQEYFSEYLSKEYLRNVLIAPFDGHSEWHTFSKNSATLDFNGDGKQDIVAFATSSCDHIYSFHKGKFLVLLDYKNNSIPEVYDSEHYFGTGKMEVNDFDNDGVSEVLFFATETKMNVYIENEDTGGHTNNPPLPPTLLYYENGLKTRFVGFSGDSHTGTSGDIDNDGDADFIQWPFPATYNFNAIKYSPTFNSNNGDLTFNSNALIRDLSSDWFASAIDLFDVNGDGNLDLIAGWRMGLPKWNDQYPSFSNSITSPMLMFGDGSGTFSLENSVELRESTLTSFGISATVLGYGYTDYDLDGDIDILVSTTRSEPGGTKTDGKYYDNYYLIIFTNNNGSFEDRTSEIINGSFDNSFNFPNFYHIRTVDFDGDGMIDIVPDGIANWGMIYSNSLYWKNQGNLFSRQNQ